MTGHFICRGVRAQILGGPQDGLDLDVVSADITIADDPDGWLGDGLADEEREFERVPCPGYGDDLCAQSHGHDPFEDGCGLCTLGSSA